MATGFLWHEKYMWHDTGSGAAGNVEPGEHFENPETKRRMKNLLDLSGMTDKLVRLDPRIATEEELLRFHTADYINRIRKLSDDFGGYAGPNTPFGKGSYEIAKLAVGGTIVATEAVLSGRVDNAYALVRPPGHHAERDLGRGFCIFGNVALAAMHAREIWGIERIVTIDWDVHHGNGTQHSFESDNSVFFFSIHQYPHYPGTGTASERGLGPGQGQTMNIPVHAGSTDTDYLVHFEQDLIPAIDQFKPEFILISAGFDAHRSDPLGQIRLSEEGYRALTLHIRQLANRHCKGRLVSLLEGGYHLTSTALSIEAHLQALLAD